jgi:multimeric flavodoxin WrbA
MKVIGINGSPRKNWNTANMVGEALKGAASKRAETELVNLYDLDFKGCVSCFGCQTKDHEGRCVQKDGLTPLLDKIDGECDALILGSPIYFSEVTSSVRALGERLLFQYCTYRDGAPSRFKRRIPVLLIYTMNQDDKEMTASGYPEKFKAWQGLFSHVLGPAKVVTSTATWQTKDYKKYGWTRFNGDERKKRHDEEFPQDLKEAFTAGADMLSV